MPKDFGAWFSEQRPVESEKPLQQMISFECYCGYRETVTREAYENGDTSWWSDERLYDDEELQYLNGKCGSQFCMP